MMQVLLGPQKMNIVCRRQRHAQFAADALRFAQRSSIAGGQMLHFDVQAVAENILELGKVIGDW